MTIWYFGINISSVGGDIIRALSVRFSDKLHKAMKLKTVSDDITIQDYIISLIKKDLNFTDAEDDLSDYQAKK